MFKKIKKNDDMLGGWSEILHFSYLLFEEFSFFFSKPKEKKEFFL
jgi:hypothetical protein